MHARVKNAPCHRSQQQGPYENHTGSSGLRRLGGGGAIPKSHRPRTPSLRSVCVWGDWDPCCLYAQICDRAHPRLGGWGVCTRVSVHSHAFAHPALGTLVSVHTRVWAHTYVWVHTCHWQSSPHFSPGPSMPGKHPHALIDLHNAHIRTLRTIYTKKPRQKLIFYFFFSPRPVFPRVYRFTPTDISRRKRAERGGLEKPFINPASFFAMWQETVSIQ